MGRSPSRGETRQKKGPWTPDGDEILVSYIQKNGHRNWISLPRLAGLNRCGKSCRLRWTNYLRPDIKRGKFTQEEEQIILNLHSILGNKWSKIAAHLPGRTDNDVKNFWNTRLKRRLRQMGFDPLTHRRLTDIFSSLSYVIATANLKDHHLHNHHHHHHQPLDQYLQYLLQLSYSNAASSSSNPSFTADMDYYLSSNRNNISSQVFNNLISTPQMLNIGTTTSFENGNSSYNPSFPFSHMPELLQIPNSGCSFDQELTLNEDQTVNGNPNHHHGFFSLSSSTSSLPSVLAPPLTTGTFINYPADSAASLPEVLLEGPLFHDTA